MYYSPLIGYDSDNNKHNGVFERHLICVLFSTVKTA